ncbi:hypothetical protein ACKGJO_06485 [Gracilimonas sp. Q87]|uniref:hypothetical protein n=1 Tax=Gracilimonas sp. Q87 TaxID=3384766 RepID=UPI003984573B
MQFRNVANAINTGIYLYLPKEVEQHLVICDPFDMPEITLHFDRIKDNGHVQYLFWDSLDDFDHIRDMKFDQYLNCLPDGHEFEDTFVALAKSMLKETSNTQ